MFEPTRSILDKRNEAVQWQRGQFTKPTVHFICNCKPSRSLFCCRSEYPACAFCTICRADQPESSGRPTGSREPARGFGLVGAHYAPDLNPDEFAWNHFKQNGTSKKPLRQNERCETGIDKDLAAIKKDRRLERSSFS